MRTNGKLRALLLTAALALASSDALAQAISDEAKQHFKAGVAFLEDPDGAKIEEAYREFKQAYEISKSPKVLGNLGICAMKLERDGEAIEALASYLTGVDDLSDGERKQVTQDLQTLRTSAVKLSLTFGGAPASDITIVDVRVAIRGDKVTNTYKASGSTHELIVRPGHHIITAKAPGFPETHWEFDASGGKKEAHAFEFKSEAIVKQLDNAPPPASVVPSKPSILPWIAVGAGGAMVVTGTVTGIVALKKTNAISAECPNNVCPSNFALGPARSSARTFVTATDVLLISGSAVVAGGLAWWLLTRNPSKAENAPPATIGCGPTGCMATVNMKF